MVLPLGRLMPAGRIVFSGRMMLPEKVMPPGRTGSFDSLKESTGRVTLFGRIVLRITIITAEKIILRGIVMSSEKIRFFEMARS